MDRAGELEAFTQLTGIPPLHWMWNLWPHALPFPRPSGLSWQASVIVELFTAACFMHSVEAQKERMWRMRGNSLRSTSIQ